MAATITSANSVLTLSVESVFPVPQQIQGFADDDAYAVDAVDNAEVRLGVDAVMSVGWIPQIKTMHVTLQADSVSADFWEEWYRQEEAQRDKFFAQGEIVQPALGKTYILTKGVLRNYTPLAPGKKVLMPRQFSIVWQSVLPNPA